MQQYPPAPTPVPPRRSDPEQSPPWRSTQGPGLRRGTKLLAAAAVAVVLAWAVAQSQVSSPIGSYLELRGQVVAPANSATLNSTLDLSGGDTVRWTSYFSSRIGSPAEAQGLLTLPAGHQWVSGSVRKPSNTSVEWQVNNGWTSSEPASGAPVTAVRWLNTTKFQANTTTVSKAVNFSGTGDGYRIIPYKDGLYVVNHHNSGNVLKCRSAADGNTCAGWDLNGYAFELNQGGALASNNDIATPANPMEALNYSTGELFVGVVSNRPGQEGAYIVCTHLDTRSACGAWRVGHGTSYTELTNFNTIDNKYYVLNSSHELVCFDIERRQLCGKTVYPSSFSGLGTSVALGSKLLFNSDSRQMFCHDASTDAPCAGWPHAGVGVGAGTGAYPHLKRDGSPHGVCSSTGHCVSMEGVPFIDSGAYSGFIATHTLHSPQYHNLDAIQGSKIYSSQGSVVACFDFATDAPCGTWNANTNLAAYTTRFDPTRPNCLMVLGDTAQAMIIDPSTGGPCKGGLPSKLPDTTVDPTNAFFQCDSSRARINAWGKVRISPSLPWGGSSGLDRAAITLKDAQGKKLPEALRPVRHFAANTYQIDISDIPYSAYPVLKIGLELHTPGSLPHSAVLGLDVTYDGDPMQVCVSTRAPASPDCQTGASVTVNTRAVDTLAGVFEETLSASTVMSPGGLSSGYAAVASATSARAVLNDLGARDPKTYVVQGRWSLQQFSGDLWAFGLGADGKIDSDSSLSAQDYTEAPSTRPMFTASPSGGAMPTKPLNWAALSLGQQDQLNLNMSGILDGKGAARLDYLRGADGGFRPRGGKSLGPVINSSPAVLLPAATLSLNERHYPGYTAYRAQVTRPHPIALFGGNDGALHAYEVRPGSLREAWSFVPEVMLRRAAHYADPSLAGVRANPYFVDNIPMIGHVNTGGSTGWRAVAVLTYGRGARAITALDVSNSDLSQGAGVLFEYSNTSDPELKDLGYIVSQPVSNNAMVSQQMVQLAEGEGRRSAVLVGNGLHSNDGQGGATANGTGKAVLFAFYLDQSGERRWQRWAVDELWAGAASEPGLSLNNGLSTPTPVDVDGDGRTDLVYAGDLQGNLWRFDVRNPAAARVTRLFKTEQRQPISQAPFVTLNPQTSGCGGPDAETRLGAKRCWQVVFSTGAPISPLQGSANVATQSIYSVLDKGTGASLTRGQLTALPYEANQVIQGVEYRALKPSSLDYQGGALGWVVDLQWFEHGVGAPRLQPSGLVMFSSIRPTTPDKAINVCIGPRSWLNELDPLNGYSPIVVFDLNGDGNIDSQDRLNPDSATPLAPSGMAVSGAQFGPPALLLASSTQAQQMSLLLPSLGQDTGQVNSWSGGAGSGGSSAKPGSNSAALTHANRAKLGRMSWREVY